MLQMFLSIHVARQYDKEELGPLHSLESRLEQQIEKMKLPNEHLKEQIDKETGEKTVLDDKYAQKSEVGFQSQWSRLMMVLKRVHYDRPNPKDMNWLGGSEGNVYRANNLPPDDFLYEIASHIINADLKYQDKKRPNRKGESDAHSSHLQMYALDKTPTQSSEYDRLYGDIRGLLEKLGIITTENLPTSEENKAQLSGKKTASLQSKFQELAKKWESNHPGRQFIRVRI